MRSFEMLAGIHWFWKLALETRRKASSWEPPEDAMLTSVTWLVRWAVGHFGVL